MLVCLPHRHQASSAAAAYLPRGLYFSLAQTGRLQAFIFIRGQEVTRQRNHSPRLRRDAVAPIQTRGPLQHAAVGNPDLTRGRAIRGGAGGHLLHHIEPGDDAANHDVLAVTLRRLVESHEKLRRIAVLAAVGHGHDAGAIVLEFQGVFFVVEFFAVDGFPSRPIKASHVPPLEREIEEEGGFRETGMGGAREKKREEGGGRAVEPRAERVGRFEEGRVTFREGEAGVAEGEGEQRASAGKTDK